MSDTDTMDEVFYETKCSVCGKAWRLNEFMAAIHAGEIVIFIDSDRGICCKACCEVQRDDY